MDALGSQFSVDSKEAAAVLSSSNTKFIPYSKLLTEQELEDAVNEVDLGSHDASSLVSS